MDKEQLIRQRAYELWNERGQPEGCEAEHWHEARLQVEADSPPEPDANGPTGAEIPPHLASVRQGEQSQGDQAPAQPQGEELKKATELG